MSVRYSQTNAKEKNHVAVILTDIRTERDVSSRWSVGQSVSAAQQYFVITFLPSLSKKLLLSGIWILHHTATSIINGLTVQLRPKTREELHFLSCLLLFHSPTKLFSRPSTASVSAPKLPSTKLFAFMAFPPLSVSALQLHFNIFKQFHLCENRLGWTFCTSQTIVFDGRRRKRKPVSNQDTQCNYLSFSLTYSRRYKTSTAVVHSSTKANQNVVLFLNTGDWQDSSQPEVQYVFVC